MKKAIDTNLIICYLTGDTPDRAEAVADLWKNSSKGELEISDVIFAEVVWVLTSFYELERDEVCDKLGSLLHLDSVNMNKKVIAKAIEIFRNSNLSYTDAYLASYALKNNDGLIYSFDQDFDKIEEVTRVKI